MVVTMNHTLDIILHHKTLNPVPGMMLMSDAVDSMHR
jgi:hypothetical protein